MTKRSSSYELKGLSDSLVDTGAQINILPLDTYLRIPEAHRPKIEKINHRIKLGDDGFMDAKGIATVKLTIAKEQ